MSFYFFFAQELENGDSKVSTQIQFTDKSTGKHTTTTVPSEMFDLFIVKIMIRLGIDDRDVAERAARHELRQLNFGEYPAHDIRRHILKEIVDPKILKRYREVVC